MNVSDQVRTLFCGALDLAGGSDKARIYLKDAALTKKSSLDVARQEDTTERKVIKGITHTYTLGMGWGWSVHLYGWGVKLLDFITFRQYFSLILQLIRVPYTIRRPAYCTLLRSTLFRSTLFRGIHLMTLCLEAPCLGAFTLLTLFLGALCLGAPCLGAFTLLTLCLGALCLGAPCLGAFT